MDWEILTPRILCVDDDVEFSATLTRILASQESVQATIDCVRSGDTALKALAASDYDLCLVDYLLEGEENGLEFIRRSIKRSIVTPMVILTGCDSELIERDCWAAGALDYLTKDNLTGRMIERAIRRAVEGAKTVRALRENERRFRSVFDGAIDAIVVCSDDGKIVDGNAAARVLFQRGAHELLGRPLPELFALHERVRLETLWRLNLLPARHLEGEFRLPAVQGRPRVIELRATAHTLTGQQLVTMREVTDRTEAEETRLRLEALVESVADGIYGTDLEGYIVYWSPAAERVYGRRADDMLGKLEAELAPADAAEELESLLERVRRGVAVREHDSVRLRQDGSPFEVTLTVSPIASAGKVTGASVITRDVSDKRRIETQLAMSDRMASVGTLAAGVAHEINNPLAAVITNLALLERGLVELVEPDGPLAGEASALAPLEDLVKDAQLGAEQARQIVRDLRIFSHPHERRKSIVDVRHVIDTTLRMAWNEIRHRARLVKDYQDSALVVANEGQLSQVFLNLVVNAAQAIEVGNVDKHELRVALRVTGDGWIVTEVTDTGHGIEEGILARIFDPFFTTKPPGVGTGLGLSICNRIVHDLGGRIAVESKPGKGTTFRVYLKAADAKAVDVVAAKAKSPLRGSTRGRILVVDDDPIMARSIARALGDEHEVQIAKSPVSALQDLVQGARPDVIVCDLMMPQMTGMEVYDEVLRVRPEQAARFVFVTGGAFTSSAQTFLAGVQNPWLEKPFEMHALRDVVNGHLDALRSR